MSHAAASAMVDPTDPSEVPQPLTSGPSEPGKILVIDDDPDSLRIIHAALRWSGHQVILAQSGTEGLEKAKTQRPRLILTDLAMPGMTGLDVIATLRHDPVTAHVPIVVISAYIGESVARAGARAGYDGCLAKPFSTKQLLQTVQEHLSPESRSQTDAEAADATAGGASGAIPWSRVEAVTRR